jgi:Family of unknown function (DUF6510)
MDETMLDGNALAGMLEEIFSVEMTTAVGTCNGCGASEPIGAVRAFLGAGAVLRCPHCDTALVKVTRSETRMWISLPGMRTLELRR